MGSVPGWARSTCRFQTPACQLCTHTFSAGPKHDPESGSTSGPADMHGNTWLVRAGTWCLLPPAASAPTVWHAQVGSGVGDDERRGCGQATAPALTPWPSGRARSARFVRHALHLCHHRPAGSQSGSGGPLTGRPQKCHSIGRQKLVPSIQRPGLGPCTAR